MIKKILLIEDRPGRQAQYLNDEQIYILNNLDYLDVPKEDQCRGWLNDINSNNLSSLCSYRLIIIHKSSLKSKGLNNLREICKKEKIDLILFSGGLSQVVYQEKEFQSLSINSSVLYTEKLKNFLENYSIGLTGRLLELAYGEQWRLEIMLRYRLLRTRYKAELNNEVKFELEDELSILGQTIQQDIKNLDNEIDKFFISI